jgi:hypothetical protein
MASERVKTHEQLFLVLSDLSFGSCVG